MTFAANVATGEVEVGSLSVTYYDSDPQRRRARSIVLLHGTSGSAAGNFWALLPMLAMRHRVVTFDFVDPPNPAGPDFYVQQASGVIRALIPDGQADLVGYSFGAVIAAAVAIRHATLVRTLTLIAGWTKTDRQQLLRNDVWRALHDDRHPALARFSVMTAYSQAFINARTDGELAALVAAAGAGPDRSAKMLFNRTVDLGDELADIAAPTLVIGCTADQMVPLRHSHMLFGAIENARLLEIDSGHAVVHERPAELFQAINRFVADPAAHAAGTVMTNLHS